jgi:hypothetical protein
MIVYSYLKKKLPGINQDETVGKGELERYVMNKGFNQDEFNQWYEQVWLQLTRGIK